MLRVNGKPLAVYGEYGQCYIWHTGACPSKIRLQLVVVPIPREPRVSPFNGPSSRTGIFCYTMSLSIHRIFVLIDYDEGVPSSNPLPRRNLDPDQNHGWLQALLYPNVLRQFGMRYTQAQLLAFMFLSLYEGKQICFSCVTWGVSCLKMTIQ